MVIQVQKIKRRVHYEIYLVALIITLIFFMLGIVLGNYIAYKKTDTLAIGQKGIAAFMDSFREKMINNESYCNLSLDEIWKEKVGIGSILASLETRLGKTDKKVLEQKKLYNEVQAQTLDIVEKVNQECGYNWDIILFFYTNGERDKRGDSQLSEYQGYVLDTIYAMNIDKAKIFSFDVNAGDRFVAGLLDQYNVTYFPSLVINGKMIEGFRSRYEIQQILDQ